MGVNIAPHAQSFVRIKWVRTKALRKLWGPGCAHLLSTDNFVGVFVTITYHLSVCVFLHILFLLQPPSRLFCPSWPPSLNEFSLTPCSPSAPIHRPPASLSIWLWPTPAGPSRFSKFHHLSRDLSSLLVPPECTAILYLSFWVSLSFSLRFTMNFYWHLPF